VETGETSRVDSRGNKSDPGAPTVFLDRDGTIIHDRGYLSDPAGVELLPNAADGLRALRASGFKLVVITNQSGVGRGYFDTAAVESIHRKLDQILASHGTSVDAYFVCPHAPQDGCECRKPKPGLISDAVRQLGASPRSSFMVGDQHTDVLAGKAAGIRTVWIQGGTGPLPLAMPEQVTADFLAADLMEAAVVIAAAARATMRWRAG
jgi:D-glycero-D-manno-heptose 1,7-bisphosphate phosphatase